MVLFIDCLKKKGGFLGNDKGKKDGKKDGKDDK